MVIYNIQNGRNRHIEMANNRFILTRDMRENFLLGTRSQEREVVSSIRIIYFLPTDLEKVASETTQGIIPKELPKEFYDDFCIHVIFPKDVRMKKSYPHSSWENSRNEEMDASSGQPWLLLYCHITLPSTLPG